MDAKTAARATAAGAAVAAKGDTSARDILAAELAGPIRRGKTLSGCSVAYVRAWLAGFDSTKAV